MASALRLLATIAFLIVFSETILVGALFALFRMAFIIGHDLMIEYIGGRERR